MENSCLNMAHYYGRKADNHLRYRRYDEAIASHQKAAELLEEAIAKTTVSKSIESLQLQRDHHLKYKHLVLMKKDHFDKYTRALEQQKMKNAEAMDQMVKDRIENSCQLQLAIYKTMEDTDSLLEVLCNKASSSSDGTCSKQSEFCDAKQMKPADDVGTSTKTDGKKSKDDSTVIEELRTLNHQLHILIFQLVSQLDGVNQESEALREKVKHLERGGRNVQTILPIGRPIEVYETMITQPLQILTDSADETLQSGQQSASSGGISPKTAESREFPPLELPNFDFTTLECKK